MSGDEGRGLQAVREEDAACRQERGGRGSALVFGMTVLAFFELGSSQSFSHESP